MSQEQWELQKYVTDAGKCPFDDWFNALDLKPESRFGSTACALTILETTKGLDQEFTNCASSLDQAIAFIMG